MRLRYLIVALLCLVSCESNSGPQEDPCDPQCVVHWTSRHRHTQQVGPMTTGHWVYRAHYSCDDKCQYLGAEHTCNITVSPPRSTN